MQERPDSSALLEAVASFLISELLPSVTDKRLAFRVMIAANLASVVSAELRTDDARFSAEVERLRALLPDARAEKDPHKFSSRAERNAALEALNRELVDKLRSGEGSANEKAARFAHVKQTALETLSVANPRFDTADEPG